MSKMRKAVTIVFAWLCMTSVAAAEKQCIIKQKLDAFYTRTGNKSDFKSILEGYQKLQKNLPGYKDEVFGGSGPKTAYIKQASDDARAYRHMIASFIAEADYQTISEPKCYICIIRRSYGPASQMYDRCTNVMKNLRDWGGVNDILDQQTDQVDKCTRVDWKSGELSRQDLQDPKLDFKFWNDMSDTIRLLDDQVTASKAANSFDANLGLIQGLLNVYIGKYVTLKEQHNSHAKNDKLSSDIGSGGLSAICPGYLDWLRDGTLK